MNDAFAGTMTREAVPPTDPVAQPLLPLGSGQPLDLGLVGNCTLGALVDPVGRLVWMCWPRLDADPVFHALLDGKEPDSGFLDVLPAGLVAHRQAYRRNTPVLETILEDREGGRLRITDFAPRVRRLHGSSCPPTFIRRVEPIAGKPLITVRARPRFAWGKEAPLVHLGGNTIRYTGSAQSMRITTDGPVSAIVGESPFVLERPLTLFVGEDRPLDGMPGPLCDELLRDTTEDWEDWSRGLSVPFEWQEAVIRSAITLKICTFEETGAVAAALTTSVPEAANSGRNWDYRFCWPRDTAFLVEAFNALGVNHTAERFMHYLSGVVRLAQDGAATAGQSGPVLKPVYPLVPGGPIEEREEDGLAGFLGMGPVRVGNGAASQVQNDSYGTVIVATSRLFFDRRLRLPAGLAEFRMLEALGETAERLAMTPDAGIWEYRGTQRVHMFSATMCWAGLARLGSVAEHLGLAAEARRWTDSAVRLRATILDRFWRPDLDSFGVALDHDGADASLLLLPKTGIIEATDPRFLGTLRRLEGRLLRDGFMMRYERPDDFGLPETAFLICSFWHAGALHAVGRTAEARATFERVLARRNAVGLLSEDLDPRTGRLWGNIPQAYSHVGLILAAVELSRPWADGLRGGTA